MYSNTLTKPINYQQAEEQFIQLLELENLDAKIAKNPSITKEFENAIATAIPAAYQDNDDAAHLFLQRILYRINRLKLFWYDDFNNYTNERSPYIQSVLFKIEEAWQKWELSQINLDEIKKLDVEAVKQALTERANFDVDPPVSANASYIRQEMDLAGYKLLLAIASFDGLVEASRLSRILGGAANAVQCTLVRVLLEEYGNGRLSRKHSTFFAQMLAEFGMNTEPEGYFDIVPWQVLACANHNFLLTECKQHFLRYNGGLTYFEVAGPSIYTNYLIAAQRLKLSEAAMGYWELHIREDERHGRWMLDDVAIPLAEQYPGLAWQLVLGYDQEKYMGDRAGDAVVQLIRNAKYTV